MATCDPSGAGQERLRLAVLGHVDHGKSTLVGRLLADSSSLPEGRLEQVQERCRRAGKTFEHAFLLDALADEQAQGITIEAARVFFRSGRREYLILDAPGHLDFLRNMVTGAAQAEAAVLVIDAEEGVQDNSRRHGALASMLGVRQLLVAVNKMDRVGWSAGRFQEVQLEYAAFLRGLGLEAALWIPVCAREGDNLVAPSARMGWYRGPTLLAALDQLPAAAPDGGGSFRLFVQDVYKFTRFGDPRRAVVGTVASGRLSVGDELVFQPSGRRSRVRSFERFAGPPLEQVGPGEAVAFTLEEPIYLPRGELAVRPGDPPPKVSRRFVASLFWLGRAPLRLDEPLTLRLGTASVEARVREIRRSMDAASLEPRRARSVGAHCVAEVVVECQRPLAFEEIGQGVETARFVLQEGYRLAGGGIIRAALREPEVGRRGTDPLQAEVSGPAPVSARERAARYGHGPGLVVITGPASSPLAGLARGLERALFQRGWACAAPDLGAPQRLGDLAWLALEAGLLLVAWAPDQGSEELGRLGALVGEERLLPVWWGAEGATPEGEARVLSGEGEAEALEALLELAQDRFGVRPG